MSYPTGTFLPHAEKTHRLSAKDKFILRCFKFWKNFLLNGKLQRGSWYHYSYGTIATYKQDGDNFGRFSKEFRYKTTWGSKDWDIIDGAVKGGLEIERKRSPWIYHYHHSKKEMWQKKNVNKTALAKRNSKTGLVAKKHPSMVKNKR